jgi:hypothetical protein
MTSFPGTCLLDTIGFYNLRHGAVSGVE